MPRPRREESRASESRKADTRDMPQAGYQAMLYVPKEIVPHGMTYGWKRLTVHNEPDHSNWGAKVRQGWKPVPRERHLDIYPHIPMPGHTTEADVIIVGGLILCEIPTHILKRFKEAKEQDTREQMESIAWTTEGFQGAPKVNESGRTEHGHAAFKEDS